MRQMKIIKGFCEEDLINKYNDVVAELGRAIVNEETVSDLVMKIYYDDKKVAKLVGSCSPVVKEGTCSACPHFESRRDEDRGQYAKWGQCKKMRANINEHHKYCTMRLKEIGQWKEVKVDIRKAQETRRLYVG